MKIRSLFSMDNYHLRFPIGECAFKDEYSAEEMRTMFLAIETFPKRLELIAQHLTEKQLAQTYREGGWTVNQIIHHCADSHLNALLRVKLTLSNDNPTINPYPEEIWAEMADYKLPFNIAITLLYCVHAKLNSIIRQLLEAELNRTYYHPQYQRSFRLKDVICLYAWHGDHHLAHIKLAINEQ